MSISLDSTRYLWNWEGHKLLVPFGMIETTNEGVTDDESGSTLIIVFFDTFAVEFVAGGANRRLDPLPTYTSLVISGRGHMK